MRSIQPLLRRKEGGVGNRELQLIAAQVAMKLTSDYGEVVRNKDWMTNFQSLKKLFKDQDHGFNSIITASPDMRLLAYMTMLLGLAHAMVILMPTETGSSNVMDN